MLLDHPHQTFCLNGFLKGCLFCFHFFLLGCMNLLLPAKMLRVLHQLPEFLCALIFRFRSLPDPARVFLIGLCGIHPPGGFLHGVIGSIPQFGQAPPDMIQFFAQTIRLFSHPLGQLLPVLLQIKDPFQHFPPF